MPPAWRHLGPLLGLMPELLREGLTGEVDDNGIQDGSADPITEVEIGWHGKGARRRRKRRVPLGINGQKPHVPSPSIVPDLPTDSVASDGEENLCDSRQREEEERCRRGFPSSLSGCRENAEIRKNQCYANKGKPDPKERRLWNRDDEEEWLNKRR